MSFSSVLLLVIALPLVLGLHAFAVYPASVWLLAQRSRRHRPQAPRPVRPDAPVDVVIACYNGAATIEATLEQLLASEYAGPLHIYVVSDASTDDTDAVIGRFASRGVVGLRLAQRQGKTAAENLAVPRLTSDVVVFMDGTSLVETGAISRLVEALHDPEVGVASGRDVSAGGRGEGVALASRTYVRFEMWLRQQESRLSSIVGASGCLYAARRQLIDETLPLHVSRDFAIVLDARRRGLRAVSVDEARCGVLVAGSLGAEYRRLERTMASGLLTLLHYREMLAPWRQGGFALMLFSHKVARWLVPAAAVPAIAAFGILCLIHYPRIAALALSVKVTVAYATHRWHGGHWPAPIAATAFAMRAQFAALRGGVRVLRGERYTVWEPTQRS